MPARHILISQEKGPAAGLAYFEEFLARITRDGTAGLPQTIAMYQELVSAGNRKARFAWYCNQFGGKFPQAMKGSVEPVEDEDDDEGDETWQGPLTAPSTPPTKDELALLATIEQAQALLAKIQAGGDNSAHSVRVDKAKARTAKKQARVVTVREQALEAPEKLWREWAVEAFGIRRRPGATFRYRSGRANTTTIHRVTRVTKDGVFAVRIG